MANIVWSFGIAINAEDQASGTIDSVIQGINTLDTSLAKLNQTQLANVTTVKSLAESYSSLKTAIDGITSGGGFGEQAAADASKLSNALEGVGGVAKDSVGEGLDLIESAVSGAIGSVLTGGMSLLKTVGSGILSFTAKIVDGILAASKMIGSALFSTIKAGFTAPIAAIRSFASGLVSMFSGIGRAVGGFMRAMESAHQAVNRFIMLGEEFYPLDKAMRQLGAQAGTVKGIRDVQNSVVDLALSTRLSVKDVGEMALALGRTGVSLDSLSKAQEINGKTIDGTQESLVKLASIYGLGAEATAKFYGDTQRLGIGFKDLATSTANFSQNFGVPGLMAELPEVTRMATDAVSRFGKYLITDEKKMIESTLKAGATFAKAFGKDAREGVQMAQESLMRFTSSLEQDQDVFLGLSDSFSGLSLALFQGGKDIGQVQALLKQGQDSPAAFARSIRGTQKELEQVYGSAYAQRWLRQITKELPAGVRDLVQSEDQLRKAESAERAAAEQRKTKGTAALEDLTKAMRDNATDSIAAFDSIGEAVRGAFAFLFADDIRTVMGNLSVTFQSFAKTAVDWLHKLEGDSTFIVIRSQFREIAELVIGVGKAGGFVNSAMGIFETFSGLLMPFSGMLGSIISGLKAVGITGALVGGVAVKAGLLGQALATVKVTVSQVASVLNNQGLTSFDKFKKVAGITFTSIKDLSKSVFNSVYETVKSAMSAIGEFIGNRIKDASAALNNNWTDIKTGIADVASSMGTTLGNIAKKTSDFIADIFNGKSLSEAWGRLTGFFQEQASNDNSVFSALSNIANKAIEGAQIALSSFLDSFLKPFGTNSNEFMANIKNSIVDLKNVFESTKEVFGSVFDFIKNGFETIAPGVNSTISIIKDGIDKIIDAYLYYKTLISGGGEEDANKAVAARYEALEQKEKENAAKQATFQQEKLGNNMAAKEAMLAKAVSSDERAKLTNELTALKNQYDTLSGVIKSATPKEATAAGGRSKPAELNGIIGSLNLSKEDAARFADLYSLKAENQKKLSIRSKDYEYFKGKGGPMEEKSKIDYEESKRLLQVSSNSIEKFLREKNISPGDLRTPVAESVFEKPGVPTPSAAANKVTTQTTSTSTNEGGGMTDEQVKSIVTALQGTMLNANIRLTADEALQQAGINSQHNKALFRAGH